MSNQEIVFRKLACDAIAGTRNFTQLGLSKDLGLSLSVINAAVRNLAEINAVRIRSRSLDVVALDRLLLYWATHRSLKKDIVYQTRAELPAKEIERNMPEGIAFTGYSGYRLLFDDAPADYSEVYAYATGSALAQIKRRFAHNDKRPNTIILSCDGDLEREIIEHKLKNTSVCAAQLFVDLWNLNQWYSKDFVDALSKRLEI